MRPIVFLLLTASMASASAQNSVITVGPDVIHRSVERFGINLSGQNFYDSGQMMRNLVFRNPGFEGETWQSILHCKTFSSNTCTDDNQYGQWPAGFLDGAQFEVISGNAAGQTGKVISSTAAHPPAGVSVKLSGMAVTPRDGDFLIVRIAKPGDATAGWWIDNKGGRLATEYHDLAPNTPGKQALRIDATAGSVGLNFYFDTLEGHSFVRLRGMHHLSFKAKASAPGMKIGVTLQRLGSKTFLKREVELTGGWHDYEIDIPCDEASTPSGNVALSFDIAGGELLLDDVSLLSPRAKNNPTDFRDEVVETLRDLHPGVLRYMDNGTAFGSSIDNLLTPAFGRQRSGSSEQLKLQEDVPVGLPEFLTLCKAVGADPWISLPPAMAPYEAAHLVEYLSGNTQTLYGRHRASLGQAAPWTEVFHTIHLELGNEVWNGRSFAGSTMPDAMNFGKRVGVIYSAMRSAPGFRADRFDLVLGAWFVNSWWTGEELKGANGTADSVAVAPYLFSEFNDAPDIEHVFGPMFAQPEQYDTGGGYMAQQLQTLRLFPRQPKLAVYEVNLGTASGKAGQAAIDNTVPSVGAALAVADHMLLMLRELGVVTQSLFCLPEYRNSFESTGGSKQTVPLWGAVVDMGGSTNLRRPSFLALQLINQTMLANMLATKVSGANPSWHQALSPNDRIELGAAHEIQSFAFGDGSRRSLIVLNLSRTDSLPVSFAGADAPSGTVKITTLTSAHITDNNEEKAIVKPVTHAVNGFNPASPYSLPPFSMTAFTWQRR